MSSFFFGKIVNPGSVGLGYFIKSSYFILNSIALLIYPLARCLGLRNQAVSLLEEPVNYYYSINIFRYLGITEKHRF
jgi:hypothetical protein